MHACMYAFDVCMYSMQVCMYVCIYVYVNVRVCMCVYVCMSYAHVCLFMAACLHVGFHDEKKNAYVHE